MFLFYFTLHNNSDVSCTCWIIVELAANTSSVKLKANTLSATIIWLYGIYNPALYISISVNCMLHIIHIHNIYACVNVNIYCRDYVLNAFYWKTKPGAELKEHKFALVGWHGFYEVYSYFYEKLSYCQLYIFWKFSINISSAFYADLLCTMKEKPMVEIILRPLFPNDKSLGSVEKKWEP